MVPIWLPFVDTLVTPCTDPWCQVTFPDAAMSLQILLNADGITMARENLQKAPFFRTMPPHSWAC